MFFLILLAPPHLKQSSHHFFCDLVSSLPLKSESPQGKISNAAKLVITLSVAFDFSILLFYTEIPSPSWKHSLAGCEK